MFHVRVERDRDSGWYVASVVELPGCYTQAEDLATLRESIIEAIELHMETLADDALAPSDFVETFKVAVPA